MRLESNGDPSNQPTRRSSRHVSNASNASVDSTPLKPTSSNSHTNGSSSNTNGNAQSNGHDQPRPPGPFFGHDREQVTRILIQSLMGLGYHREATSLSRESGFDLENPTVAAFRAAVQHGDWARAEALLFGADATDPSDFGGVGLSENGQKLVSPPNTGLLLAEGADKREMLFCIRQQKYLELLEARDLGTALMVLREELTPLHQDTARLHALSGLIMLRSANDLKAQAMWDGAAGHSRHHLLSQLSKSIAPAVMIPENRLAVLFSHVQETQIDDCLYHNTVEPPSLYRDHACDPADFPLQTMLQLRDHSDEVWYICFSHDGSMLATAGKDSSVFVYCTTTWTPRFHFKGGSALADSLGVSYVAWSPDDKHLLCCSQGNELAIYNVSDDNGERIAITDSFGYPVTTAAWLADGRSFVVGSQDSAKPLGLYSLDDPRQPIHTWFADDKRALRIDDCSISGAGDKLAAITKDNSILLYDLETKLKLGEWLMEDKLTCINLSHDGQTFLVSMNGGRLLLMDAETGEVIQRYTGLKQNDFVIRSSFGGAGENFVISGSEDSHVYIWRKHNGIQVAALEAHSPGTVNSVAWHPTNPAIWASAGDDRRVKIWSNPQTISQRATELRAARGGGDRAPGYLR